MHPTSGTAQTAPVRDDTLAARLVPSLLAALLGLGLLYAAGFAEMDVLHNAAHDARHSAAFPCH